MPNQTLSDKAVAVFAFAAYHQLSSGEPVVDVVLQDKAGHKADPAAIAELEEKDLARAEDDRAVFTDRGRVTLGKVVDALRAAA